MWHLVSTNVTQAWEISAGDPSVIVAVLDSGTDWEHPDLGIGSDSYQNIFCNVLEDDWSSPGNPNSGNHVDDDANGLIDDYKGWNFAASNNDSRSATYHGTFVAGVVGAKTNNGIGISGVAGGNNCHGVSILPYCVGATAPITDVIDDAIIAAVDNGSKIIQFSLSCSMTNSIKSALQYAKNNNVVVVCATGNESESSLPFPSSDTTVVAVGAINSSSQRAYFSNYGSNLRVVAPGVNIKGLNLTSQPELYICHSGTSYAAPQVSGIAALMLSVNPLLSRSDVIDIIESTAQKVGNYNYTTNSNRPNGTWNNEMGYGLVDAYGAVTAAKARAPYIDGSAYYCDGSYYYVRNVPTGASIQWSLSPWSCGPLIDLVGDTNKDSVMVGINNVVRGENNPAAEEQLLLDPSIPTFPPFPPFPQDTTCTLTVTVSINGVSYSATKTIYRNSAGVPNINATDTATQWQINTVRVFSVTNCQEIPDSLLRWEVYRRYAPLSDSLVYQKRGRNIFYTPRQAGLYTVRAINDDKHCGVTSSSKTYFVKSGLPLDALNGEEDPSPEGEESPSKELMPAVKILRDGDVYILRDDKIYKQNGTIVR